MPPKKLGEARFSLRLSAKAKPYRTSGGKAAQLTNYETAHAGNAARDAA